MSHCLCVEYCESLSGTRKMHPGTIYQCRPSEELVYANGFGLTGHTVVICDGDDGVSFDKTEFMKNFIITDGMDKKELFILGLKYGFTIKKGYE